MGLGLGSILITMVSATPGAIIALVAVIVGIIKGEYSWAVWLGFILAFLYVASYIFMFVGEGLLK